MIGDIFRLSLMQGIKWVQVVTIMNNVNPMSTSEPCTMVSSGYVEETKPLLEQYCQGLYRRG